jgi:hypothetical protein
LHRWRGTAAITPGMTGDETGDRRPLVDRRIGAATLAVAIEQGC